MHTRSDFLQQFLITIRKKKAPLTFAALWALLPQTLIYDPAGSAAWRCGKTFRKMPRWWKLSQPKHCHEETVPPFPITVPAQTRDVRACLTVCVSFWGEENSLLPLEIWKQSYSVGDPSYCNCTLGRTQTYWEIRALLSCSPAHRNWIPQLSRTL